MDDTWNINRTELTMNDGTLGSGHFGIVYRGTWRGRPVAIKKKKWLMPKDRFTREAEIMKQLRHQNVLQLHGVCVESGATYIVLEYMEHGSLLDFLHRNRTNLIENRSRLLNICNQVCSGMAHLESRNVIHRDLSARNCLVGSGYVVKVADLGMARYAVGGEYESSHRIFDRRWAAPEVLASSLFSSKSDVWSFGDCITSCSWVVLRLTTFALKLLPLTIYMEWESSEHAHNYGGAVVSEGTKFEDFGRQTPQVTSGCSNTLLYENFLAGVLMWEVFTCGEKPYEEHSWRRVQKGVNRGELGLHRPPACPQNVYAVMQQCWNYNREERPSFHDLQQLLAGLAVS